MNEWGLFVFRVHLGERGNFHPVPLNLPAPTLRADAFRNLTLLLRYSLTLLANHHGWYVGGRPPEGSKNIFSSLLQALHITMQ